ncbi:DUF58 domain-containing protein [Halapricum salinum]|uniref:DUF58 domain-containing protein n=1 Tax=Halapricum salinum TaxID=1457250 RepID=A0A4D6HEA6_9EURY|nr:DUF58 domain-containing protein [Halapricum salinum]QCC52130.1 DUF58 domain-containing protein [Halapricum salinum]
MARRRHHRFSVALAGALLAASVALLYATPSAFLLAIVPLGYVVYGALSSYPDPEIEIERSLSPRAATPGSIVTVTLTVRNAGSRLLADVRVVDGVPAELAVVAGSPRACLSIPAGERRTVSYDVLATRGDHDFEATRVIVRSISGTRLRTRQQPAAGAQILSCSTAVEQAPIRRSTRSRTGTLATDSGGAGLEFHSTREYRSGDPIRRIDWRRFARTDELSTIDFREERAARLVIVIDVRPPSRRSPHAGFPTGAELSGYAAERAYEALTAAGHQVEITAIGLDDVDVDGVRTVDGLPWIDSPAAGGSDAAARQLFDAVYRASTRADATVATDGSGTADPETTGKRLRSRLPTDAEVLLVSPLLDHLPRALVESITPQDVAVTVVSPDVTAAETVGGRLAALQRENRLRAIRAGGTTVADWALAQPLDVALETALRLEGSR